jgi:hypothetical protein
VKGYSGPPPPDEDLVLTDVEKRALIELLQRTLDDAAFRIRRGWPR